MLCLIIIAAFAILLIIDFILYIKVDERLNHGRLRLCPLSGYYFFYIYKIRKRR